MSRINRVDCLLRCNRHEGPRNGFAAGDSYVKIGESSSKGRAMTKRWWCYIIIISILLVAMLACKKPQTETPVPTATATPYAFFRIYDNFFI